MVRLALLVIAATCMNVMVDCAPPSASHAGELLVRERAYSAWLANQNRNLREALAAEFCALPANKTRLTVHEYQREMNKHSETSVSGVRRFLEISNGGYCLAPQTHRTWISPGNPLAVGHKLPERGLLKGLSNLLPQAASVLEVGAGQGPLKAAFNRTRCATSRSKPSHPRHTAAAAAAACSSLLYSSCPFSHHVAALRFLPCRQKHMRAQHTTRTRTTKHANGHMID